MGVWILSPVQILVNWKVVCVETAGVAFFPQFVQRSPLKTVVSKIGKFLRFAAILQHVLYFPNEFCGFLSIPLFHGCYIKK